ncbi:glycosyltransferase [Palleronia sp. LCG004]|uniref:glycosyltransferase n=1 Tax=Palleronia sp. LCG004 TaxID=3079304 RepID=UPI0029432945|nr:glycosyltransferase [Palleronia sp. LCG004]WOI58394.1 glycosyltransferase [Palleronia sp. LCG004]
MPSTSETRPIAYLSGMYPAVSQTFIQREIEALRAAGADIRICSIRATPASEHIGPVDRAHAAEAFNVLPATLSPKALGAFLWALKRPGDFGKMLKLAWKTRAPGAKALAYQAIYAAEAMVLARYLDQIGAGHIHNHFVSSSATVAMLAATLARIPFSYTLHGPADFIEPLRWKIGEKTARAAFVACISHYARSQAMVFSDPVHWDRLKIVHCGVEPDLYGGDRPVCEAGEPVRFLFVGRLARVKGLLVLLEALERMGDVNLRLDIVGDGPDRALLEDRARPLGDRVRFLGYRRQDEVAGMLNETDIFVLPSFAEGVPVVLMEALAAGRPVVATQVAGVSELVEDSVSGFIVPPGDIEALSDRIRRLATDPALRARMEGAGREKVAHDYDASTEARRLLALFAGERRAGARPD